MNKPIRMCIVCKERIYQEKLIRLQCKNGKLAYFTGIGRSFYICKNCIMKNNGKLLKPFSRFCKQDKKTVLKILSEFKENIVNG
ncbi:MAG: DUF448 domain-containing protein [Epsilonproteobacteria bacterium]|nr:DUF448 domain-containing protein [Campylobacterota bacterium]